MEAEALAINTQNASVGNPFTENQIKGLPLQTRNVVALLSLQPGVAPDGQVLGAKPDQNNVTLDGVDVNDNEGNSGFNAVLPVPLDSVQEFRTTVAGQGADQGRSAGGQVSLVTKGGSNQFHGSLYEYMRNTYTAANSWFNNRAGVARTPLVRNQYGASLGGRLIRNRAFFFFNWEDRKDRSGSVVTRTVPSETYQAGHRPGSAQQRHQRAAQRRRHRRGGPAAHRHQHLHAWASSSSTPPATIPSPPPMAASTSPCCASTRRRSWTIGPTWHAPISTSIPPAATP